MTTEDIIIRESMPSDVPQLIALRMQLFNAVTEMQAEAAEEVRIATERFFHYPEQYGQNKTWVAVSGSVLVATGTLAEFHRPPYPGNLQGVDAYLLNMFTVPESRRKGVSYQLLKQILRYAKHQGYGKVWLHTSADGRALYEKAGFVGEASFMEWVGEA